MSSGEIDTTALIVSICVIIPALIAISVCVIIYFSHRNKDRKLQRQPNASTPYEYPPSRERAPQDTYVIDFSRVNRQQQHQQRRPPPPVFEPSPPPYETSIVQTRQQQRPIYSPVRMAQTSTNIRRSSPMIARSVHSVMPPSYAEIFLTPHTLPNE